eukprot:4281627-Prymnesium_polylepis.2
MSMSVASIVIKWRDDDPCRAGGWLQNKCQAAARYPLRGGWLQCADQVYAIVKPSWHETVAGQGVANRGSIGGFRSFFAGLQKCAFAAMAP